MFDPGGGTRKSGILDLLPGELQRPDRIHITRPQGRTACTQALVDLEKIRMVREHFRTYSRCPGHTEDHYVPAGADYDSWRSSADERIPPIKDSRSAHVEAGRLGSSEVSNRDFCHA